MEIISTKHLYLVELELISTFHRDVSVSSGAHYHFIVRARVCVRVCVCVQLRY